MPIGVPGCPDFAFSTASTARKRIVLTQFSSSLSFLPTAGWLLDSAMEIAAAPSAAVESGAGVFYCKRAPDYTRRTVSNFRHK